MTEITQADRIRWQRQDAGELAAILDACLGLPVIMWMVGPVGGGLSGCVNGLAPAAGVRAAFAAWQQALVLDDVLETVSDGGAAVWLRARAWRGTVRVTITATVFTGDQRAVTA